MMMKRIRTWGDMMGKTVEKVEIIGADVVLVFDNDTYAMIRSGPSYDGDRSEPELDELDGPEGRVNETDAHKLAQLGVWDNDDWVHWETAREERTKVRATETEKRERETLANLKAKYEQTAT